MRYVFGDSELRVSYKVAIYKGKMFGEPTFNDKTFTKIYTGLFGNMKNVYQDFGVADKEWSKFFRSILDQRLKNKKENWFEIFDLSLPRTASEKEIEAKQLELAHHLYYAASGQVRNMGKILELVGPERVSCDCISDAARKYFKNNLRDNLIEYLPDDKEQNGALAAAMRLLHVRISLAVEANSLHTGSYFNGSFAVLPDSAGADRKSVV